MKKQIQLQNVNNFPLDSHIMNDFSISLTCFCCWAVLPVALLANQPATAKKFLS